MFERVSVFGVRAAVWSPDPPPRVPGRMLIPGPGSAVYARAVNAVDFAAVGEAGRARPVGRRRVRIARSPGSAESAEPGAGDPRGPRGMGGPRVSGSTDRPRRAGSRRGGTPSPGTARAVVLPWDPPAEVRNARRLGAFVPELAAVDDDVRDRLCDDTAALAWAGAALDLGCWRSRLAHAEPGPELAAALTERPNRLAPGPGRGNLSTDHETRWADAVLASIQARARLISHLQAAQYADVAELSAHYPAAHEFLATEIGLALSCTEASARSLLGAAEAFRDRLPATLEALSAGLLDEAKACAILAATAPTSDEVAAAVEAKVVPGAATVTATTVRRRCERAIIEVDPHGAEERHERRARERHVSRWPEADGMAGLRVYSTAQDIAVVWEALTGLADAAKTPGDPRDLGNRRVDALVGLCVAAVDGDVVAGLAGSAGSGPVGSTAFGSATRTAGGASLMSRRQRTRLRARPLVRVTMPITALLGGEEPCELDGWGPITAAQARAIAADATLTRLVCDPLSGTLLDYGLTRYHPPDTLKDFVRARDRTCVMPGCHQPAERCDIDHVIPARRDPVTGLPTLGPTSADNLAVESRHHHLSKDGGGGYRLRRDPDGGYTWTTPLGRSYRRDPERLWHPAVESTSGPPADHGPQAREGLSHNDTVKEHVESDASAPPGSPGSGQRPPPVDDADPPPY